MSRISPCSTDREGMEKFFVGMGLEYSSSLVPCDSLMFANFLERCQKTRDRWVEEGYTVRIDSWETQQEKIAEGRVAPLRIAYINEVLGYGCFAAEDIPRSAFIGEYTGKIVIGSAGTYGLAYVPTDHNPLSYSEPRNGFFSIDAKEVGNEMRFVNYSPRSVDVEVDAEVREACNIYGRYRFVDGLWHFTFTALRDISQGEELRGDFYGHDYFQGMNSIDAFMLVGEDLVQIPSEYNKERKKHEDDFREYGLNCLF